ncbi:MAG: hypothetical protein V1781_00130, partial [Bacteroidota bacterium]
NILTIVSDKKNPVSANGNTVDYYKADLVSSTDYYPFGSPLPTRTFSSQKYRFGFNGVEKDDEVKGSGNWYTFGDYGYDPRVVQRPSPDPLWKKYPSQSPYAAFNGNPILYNDPTGESGEVSINKEIKTITVTSNLVLYGGSASTELAKQTATDIQNKWNAANGKVNIGGVEYSVKFSIVGEYKPDLTPDQVAKNTDIKQNFIRVEETASGNISYMDELGANTSYFLLSNIKGEGTTTEAHEFGHGYGLEHSAGNQIGKGQPDIMAARGTLVDPKYQYDPKAKAGEKGGTLNPETRKVTQQDITDLGLDKLKFDKSGKSNLGKLTNAYHKKEEAPKK